MIKFFILMSIHLFSFASLFSLTVGSDSAVSRQALATFTAAGAPNTMLGFAAFAKGFTLADRSTTCTFDCFMPISGNVSMNLGELALAQDLVIANSCTFKSGGRFRGYGRSIEFGKNIGDLNFPSLATSGLQVSLSLGITASTTINGGVAATATVGWSRDDRYIAAGTRTTAVPNLRIYHFIEPTLTTTHVINYASDVLATVWNPKSDYLVVSLADGTNNLVAYRHNVWNGTFVQTDSITVPNASDGVSDALWHPSGNFIALGPVNGANTNFIVYPFSQVTGLFGTPITLASGLTSLFRVAWSPTGDYLAYGTANNAATGVPELYILSFNGTSLTLTTSAEIGGEVQGLEWSPTGSYLALGLGTGTQRLRIYRYLSGTSTISEVQTARQGETRIVYDMAWESSGQYMLAGIGNGASSAVDLYAFDKTALTLTLAESLPIASDVKSVTWSNSNRYAAYESLETDFVISTSSPSQFLFRDIDLIFNSKVNLFCAMKFYGNCKINARGKIVTLVDTAQITVMPGGSLILEDTIFEGLRADNLRCLSDQGSMTFKNSILGLSDEYTFSRGSIFIDEQVMITGGNKFNYTTGLSSTIGSKSTLFLDRDVTFSYQPRRARSNLITMADSTACLYLNGCTLHSTRTGLNLSTGSLIIDDKVTFTSEARSMSEALFLNSNLSAKVRGDAVAEFFGLVRYD